MASGRASLTLPLSHTHSLSLPLFLSLSPDLGTNRARQWPLVIQSSMRQQSATQSLAAVAVAVPVARASLTRAPTTRNRSRIEGNLPGLSNQL